VFLRSCATAFGLLNWSLASSQEIELSCKRGRAAMLSALGRKQTFRQASGKRQAFKHPVPCDRKSDVDSPYPGSACNP